MTFSIRPTAKRRLAFFLISDLLLSVVTLFCAYLLRFNFDIPAPFMTPFGNVLGVLLALKLTAIYVWKNYAFVWRFYSLPDLSKLLYAHLSAYGIFVVFYLLFSEPFSPFPRSVVIIDLVLSFVMLGSLRLLKPMILLAHIRSIENRATMIFGISANTSNFIQSLREGLDGYTPRYIVQVRPENHHMVGQSILNVDIIDYAEAIRILRETSIKIVLLDGSLSSEYLQSIYGDLSSLGIAQIKRLKLFGEHGGTIENLSIEELLARHPKDLNTEVIQRFIQQKTVLITGAGGSIGSEIALQCAHFGASRLILVDHSEYNLYQIGEKLPGTVLHLCNIIDYNALDAIIEATSPDIVIHAAAYKHVPLCEHNPHAAIMNNVIGSRNVIDSAIKHNVFKIVIISTDKAVRPTNVMGATKRIVELYAQNVDPCNSEIVAVRFGNVLGSSGSVIPKFKAQIEAGGPLTITHPEVTRYFMLISEACQLVLQAASIAKGGELFILDMGERVKIVDLAQTMIRLYAIRPIDIVYTGLREGEKLYEELLIDEREQKTSYESIMIAGQTHYPIEKLNGQINQLIHSRNPKNDLKAIVAEYSPSGEKGV